MLTQDAAVLYPALLLVAPYHAHREHTRWQDPHHAQAATPAATRPAQRRHALVALLVPFPLSTWPLSVRSSIPAATDRQQAQAYHVPLSVRKGMCHLYQELHLAVNVCQDSQHRRAQVHARLVLLANTLTIRQHHALQ